MWYKQQHEKDKECERKSVRLRNGTDLIAVSGAIHT